MDTTQTGTDVPWESIQVVSLDVDGTLYDARPVIRRFLWFVFLKFITLQFELVFGELKSLIRAYQDRKRIHKHRGDYRFEVDPDVRSRTLECTSRFIAPQIARQGLRPGVRQTILKLKEQGFKVVALSDYYSDAKLRCLGVHTLFDAVYAAESTGHLKPHPTGFLAVCRGEGIEPRQLLHVGDRDETDGVGARKAGASSLILSKDFDDFLEFPLL